METSEKVVLREQPEIKDLLQTLMKQGLKKEQRRSYPIVLTSIQILRMVYETRADASSRMSIDQISDVALSIEYVKQYTDSHSGIGKNHAYLLRQLVVWQRLSVHLGWQCDNVRASYDEIPKATQDEVFSGAKAFVKENKGRYDFKLHPE